MKWSWNEVTVILPHTYLERVSRTLEFTGNFLSCKLYLAAVSDDISLEML